MTEIRSRILLVEGAEDLRVIPELMEVNGVDWGPKHNPTVYIRDSGGYQKLIASGTIPLELKNSDLAALGIVIDADDDPLARWQSIREASATSIPDLPETLPEEGLIHTAYIPAIYTEIQFGIWMMPDNKLRGMLETFLTYLIPSHEEPLWQFAQAVTEEAKDKGAVFKSAHIDKVNIYTWLAWQDPPGRQLHQAVKQGILNPKHPDAQRFVSWFKSLYRLA